MACQDVERLRHSFQSGKSKPISWRRTQLKALMRMLDENVEKFCHALWEDLHKNPEEAEMMEVAQVRNEVVFLLEHLDKLSCDTKCQKSMISLLNDVKVIKEPLGVVLMISPWNYPLLLALQPLAGAIAAGNCVLLKPSEISQATAHLIKSLVPQYLDKDCCSIFIAGPKESNDLLCSNRFDLIMYTGGSAVGKIVMQAAAKHLTPVILELGGKNPCYIDSSCDLESTARRVTWGKWTNAGQICVSVDFILCNENIKAPLIAALKKCVAEYYGENPKESTSYGRIINQRHVQRLKSLLKDVDVVYGGDVDEDNRYFSPTIVTNVCSNAPILQEEIFGPVLPIIPVNNVDEAIEYMNSGGKSLQLSIFAKDRSVIDKVISETSSGGVTVNDLLMQHNELGLPFGGVGDSGIGNYHGASSFNSFSHLRGYFECKTPEFALMSRYPPCTASKLAMLKPLAYKRRKMFKLSSSESRIMFAALLGLVVAYLVYIVK